MMTGWITFEKSFVFVSFSKSSCNKHLRFSHNYPVPFLHEVILWTENCGTSLLVIKRSFQKISKSNILNKVKNIILILTHLEREREFYIKTNILWVLNFFVFFIFKIKKSSSGTNLDRLLKIEIEKKKKLKK